MVAPCSCPLVITGHAAKKVKINSIVPREVAKFSPPIPASRLCAAGVQSNTPRVTKRIEKKCHLSQRKTTGHRVLTPTVSSMASGFASLPYCSHSRGRDRPGGKPGGLLRQNQESRLQLKKERQEN